MGVVWIAETDATCPIFCVSATVGLYGRGAVTRFARQLVMMLPGMEAGRFFTELGAVMAQGQPGRTALNAFGAGWGVEFLGPPLAVPASAGESTGG